eukprot:gb/GECG01012084.1/.p1 GENE.gb/GECG01012084.1/~~gb/GECG01012084.1/.p1  ORF type:complete len:181 (+),score=4.96 gb/GECG01012084.1/:1-543(+)
MFAIVERAVAKLMWMRESACNIGGYGSFIVATKHCLGDWTSAPKYLLCVLNPNWQKSLRPELSLRMVGSWDTLDSFYCGLFVYIGYTAQSSFLPAHGCPLVADCLVVYREDLGLREEFVRVGWRGVCCPRLLRYVHCRTGCFQETVVSTSLRRSGCGRRYCCWVFQLLWLRHKCVDKAAL